MITIDGSHGEGGGQVLRTALALSAVTGTAFSMHSIRVNRRVPGLRPQHLTGLTAMADICRADIKGAKVGSKEVSFHPKGVRPGSFLFDVSKTTGSAGSVTLISQTLLPALALCPGRSDVTIKGGTHVSWSPSFDYLDRCFLPAASRLGLMADASIVSFGYYPKGGGEMVIRIEPVEHVGPVELLERDGLVGVTGVSAVSNLPVSIAERQTDSVLRYLSPRGIVPDVRTGEAPSPGQGTFMHLTARFGNIEAGFTALGERGKRAEAVGEEAASALVDFLESGACVETHLADQIVLYMALANGVSRMSVQRVSRHLLTNIWVIGQFLPRVSFEVDGVEGEPGTVTVRAPE